MPALIGAHMSIAGGCDRAVLAASRIGFQTVQLFTKNNNQWRAPELTDAQRAAFRTALQETGVVLPVAHTSYLINLASPNETLWNQSIDALTVEVERCEALGIKELVMHPGAHTGSGEETGLKRVAEGLNEVHRRTWGVSVAIDLETTAGQGSCLGHRFEHLQHVLDQVLAPERLGVCIDTCHIFAAGYSFAAPEEYDEVMNQVEQTVGLDRVRVWHLNDSVRELGSRVDRHAGIGRGRLGLEPFRHIVNDARFGKIPLIMETPKGTEEGQELDVLNLQTLRNLERETCREDPSPRAPVTAGARRRPGTRKSE